MGASKTQWEALIGEIEGARNQRLDSDDQLDMYFRHLSDISFERARRGAEHLIKHYKGYQFPSVATIREHCDKASGSGGPNAISYSQDPSYKPWGQTPEGAYAVWRDEQVIMMRFPFPLPGEPEEFETDEDRTNALEMRYWAYVHDQDGYKGRCASHWRQEWKNRAQRQLTTVN